MFTQEEKYAINEAKLNTSQVLLFTTIVSSVFLVLLMDLSNTVVQIIGVVTIFLEFLFIYGTYTLNKRQKELLEEIGVD